TKLLIPDDFALERFLDNTQEFADLINHNKFANNYTYHKAIFLMNLTEHLDTGYLLVKEDEKLHSPLACIFYERYSSVSDAQQWLDKHADEIQVVVSHREGIGAIDFGTSQQTVLSDYADGVNTLEFLSQL
ncbi:MAG: acyl-CoA reductase, partial [Bacteroidia bacterium]|nr:acyl-CoA reductase [Bacteroidia bacterium]